MATRDEILEAASDQNVVEAWTEELRRRADEVRSGAVVLDDWSTIRQQLAVRRSAR
jgi:hypothetical protein